MADPTMAEMVNMTNCVGCRREDILMSVHRGQVRHGLTHNHFPRVEALQCTVEIGDLSKSSASKDNDKAVSDWVSEQVKGVA